MATHETTLLIVGAGPTGLSAALSLVDSGFTDFVIVEQAPFRGEASRAMTIHAATLESLDSIGCADLLIARGLPGLTMQLCDRRNLIPVTDYSCLRPYTKFPYVLLLSQKDTEEVLENRLLEVGHKVRRGEKVVGLQTRDDGRYEVTLDTNSTIVAQHIIGADGARSVIRQISGISFTDPDGHEPDERLRQMIFADVCFSSDSPMLPKQGMIGTGTAGLMFLLISLPHDPESSERPYRIGFNVSGCDAPQHPSVEFLQKYLNDRGPIPLSSDSSVNPNPIHISKKLWATRFRTHAAIAGTFMKPSDVEHSNFIFLLGDAAHIHAPAGGLGMNLSIRDAIGLGPLLAEYLHSTGSAAKDPTENLEVLIQYITSRREKALSQVRLTKRLMKGASIFSMRGTFNLQYWILRIVGLIPFFRNRLAWVLSGLGNR